MSDNNRYAVDKYLEQVKVVTALSSALFISPAVIVAFLKYRSEVNLPPKQFGRAAMAVTVSSILFLIAIVLTYFICSSIVGQASKGHYDVNRLITRVFSILQFTALLVGCGFFIWFIRVLLIP